MFSQLYTGFYLQPELRFLVLGSTFTALHCLHGIFVILIISCLLYNAFSGFTFFSISSNELVLHVASEACLALQQYTFLF